MLVDHGEEIVLRHVERLDWGLRPLGQSDVALCSEVSTPRGIALVRELVAAFQGRKMTRDRQAGLQGC
jgi:hypothetical protein